LIGFTGLWPHRDCSASNLHTSRDTRDLSRLIAGFGASASAPAGAPNVLIILLDDAGYSQTSTFAAAIATPTLDALALMVCDTHAFHVTALCSPTRAAH